MIWAIGQCKEQAFLGPLGIFLAMRKLLQSNYVPAIIIITLFFISTPVAADQIALPPDAVTSAYCEGVIASRIEMYEGFASHDCPAKVDPQMCENLANKEIERLRQNMRWILVYLEPYGHDFITAAALQNFIRAGMDDDLSGMQGGIKLLDSECMSKAKDKDKDESWKTCDPSGNHG